MGSFSSYLNLQLLDHIWGNDEYSPPSTLYIGLSTTSISADGSGITEPSGNNYSRAQVTNNLTNWPAAQIVGSNGRKENGQPIEFPEATGNWGEIVAFFISDASTGGNLIAFGDLTTPREVIDGDIARFNDGAIVITLGS